MLDVSSIDTPTEGDTDVGVTEPGNDRRVTIWDLAGLLLPTFAVLAAMSLTPLAVQGWFYQSQALFIATIVVGLAAAGLLAKALRQERPPTATALVERLTLVWRDPPGSWPAFVLGTVLSLPLFGMYTSELVPDTDSMRLVASIRHVQRGNLDFLVETQDSFGPHILLGPLLAVAGGAGVRLFTILSMQLLVASVAWVTYRVSKSMGAAAITVLALLALEPFMGRALVLPMYPAMLAFGCLGTWLAYRAIGQHAGWAHAFGAGFLLVLAYESHQVGQLLLAAPLLLLVTATDLRRGLGGMARVYTCVGIALLPRIVVNLSEGGLSHFITNRTDYWITEGYLRLIQEDFMRYSGLGESPLGYLLQLPERFFDSLGTYGWLGLALAVVAVIGLRGRARWFALAFVTLIAAAMTVRTIQPNARYFSPLWPGLAVLAGVAGIAILRRRQLALRVIGSAVVLSLVGASLYNLRETAIAGRDLANAAERRGFTTAVDLIDDDKGVIGVRAHVLNSADPDLPTYGAQFLSEEEFVTYLTWPSDAEVVEIMERHDIGWVMTTKQRRLDYSYYNAWLVPTYGVRARHLDMLKESPDFCRVQFEGRVTLYKLGDCPDGT
jgi:hypothetical protein